jgi:hypothetical protein
MPLTRAPKKSWPVGSTILGLLDAHKWIGAELWKRPFRVMTFQPSSSNDARWRLIETNGVLFAVIKRLVLWKRHRPPPETTSGLSFDTTMYPHEYKNFHGKPRWANKMNRKREKIHKVRPAGLKTRRSFSYTITTKISCFWLCCCSLHNPKWIIGD